MPLANQVYLGLPDGRLDEQNGGLDRLVEEVVLDIEPDRIFTSGADGFDSHPDHIAAHYAALRAATRLQRLGSEVTAWSLVRDEVGDLWISGNHTRKIGAMAFHASQNVGSDMTRWGDTDLYTPVITGAEVYRQEIFADSLVVGTPK